MTRKSCSETNSRHFFGYGNSEHHIGRSDNNHVAQENQNSVLINTDEIPDLCPIEWLCGDTLQSNGACVSDQPRGVHGYQGSKFIIQKNVWQIMSPLICNYTNV